MSDPLHHDSTALTPRPDGADVHTQIEELLLVGLDHYFAARYDEALHVWTRVLFLDRGHARARAYIERARGALAERQRESEELLHHGVDAFDRGDASAARELLNTAVDRGAPQEEALALLGRLDRLAAAGEPMAPAAPPRRARRRAVRQEWSAPAARPRATGWLVLLAVVASLAVGAALVATFGDAVGRWFLFEEVERASVPAAAVEKPLAVPSASETTIARARAIAVRTGLGQGGALTPADQQRLREALVELDRIGIGDPHRAEADALVGQIQRALLDTVEGEPAAPAGGRSGQPR